MIWELQDYNGKIYKYDIESGYLIKERKIAEHSTKNIEFLIKNKEIFVPITCLN